MPPRPAALDHAPVVDVGHGDPRHDAPPVDPRTRPSRAVARRTAAPTRAELVALGVVCAVGFFLMGLVAAVVGPSLPALRARFALTATGASLLVSVYSVGAVAGTLTAGWLLARIPARRLLAISGGAVGLGCLALVLAPTASTAALSLAVAGAGYGALGITLNLLPGRVYGTNSSAVLIGLSACFGLSAIVGPLLVSRSPGNATMPFLSCVALAAVLAALTRTVGRAGDVRDRRRLLPSRLSARDRGALLGFGLLLLTYVAVETGAAGWETTYLRGTTSLAPGAAAGATAVFWLGLTVGRVLAVPVAMRVAPGRLAAGCMALATVSLFLGLRPGSAVWAFGFVGLFLAPVFPVAVTWLARAVPGGRGATPVFAGCFLGPVLASPLLGASTDAVGPRAIPVLLGVLGLVGVLLAAGLLRRLAGEVG